jgi:hypothetical protein
VSVHRANAEHRPAVRGHGRKGVSQSPPREYVPLGTLRLQRGIYEVPAARGGHRETLPQAVRPERPRPDSRLEESGEVSETTSLGSPRGEKRISPRAPRTWG